MISGVSPETRRSRKFDTANQGDLKMPRYSNAIRDERVRDYLPVRRVMLAERVEKADILPGNTACQVSLSGLEKCCVLKHGASLLVDFGIELHGGIRIVNRGKAGRVRVRFGESASEAMNSPNQDHAIHDAELDAPAMGMLEYGNTAFRFVRIDRVDDAEHDLRLMNILAVALYRDLKRSGEFKCSDERLNRIWETGAYTLQLNMQDYIYDGVKRDRLVWMGDLHPEICGMLALFDDVRLIPKSLDFVRDITPLPQVMNGIVSYSMWWVINQYEYYLGRGDLEYLRQQRQYLETLVAQLAGYVGRNGAEKVPPHRFLDWPSSSDETALHAGLHGLLCWTFQCAAELYAALGLDAAALKRLVRRMKRYVPDCGRSKAAAAMLTLSGVADRSDVLLRNPFRGVSTFYGFYMLLAQPTASALKLIRRYWGAMLDYGATTFWEDFDLAWVKNASPISELPVPGKADLHADFGNYCYKGLRHSLCHGWASGPTPFLSRRVLGVKFHSPGGRRVEVKPDLGGLEFAEGSFPTPFGAIKVCADRFGKTEISAPPEVEIKASAKQK